MSCRKQPILLVFGNASRGQKLFFFSCCRPDFRGVIAPRFDRLDQSFRLGVSAADCPLLGYSPCELRFANEVKKSFTFLATPRGEKNRATPEKLVAARHPMSASREIDSSEPPLLRKCYPKGFFKAAFLAQPGGAIAATWHARVCNRLLSQLTPPTKKHRANGTVPFVLTLIYRLARPSGLSEIGSRF